MNVIAGDSFKKRLSQAVLIGTVIVGCTSTGMKDSYVGRGLASAAPQVAAGVERNYTKGTLRHVIWNIDQYADVGINLKPAAPGIPTFKQAIVMNFGKQDGIMTPDAAGTGVNFDASWDKYTTAQKRVRAMFIVSRLMAEPFFGELRVAEPVFYLPGDDKERNLYVLARYHAMRQSFGYMVPDSAPEHLTVTYNRHVTTPDGTGKLMDNVAKGSYMLSGERMPANEEKPHVHHVIDAGLDKAAAAQRVRKLVAKLTMDAIRDHATADSFDFAQYVARVVPLQVVGEYFGFYPPDLLTQIQWSRNTQNSFFHNPTNFTPIDSLALRSGTEMQSYITASLLPDVNKQLVNKRPANDALSRMLKGHVAGLKATSLTHLNEKVVTHAMGFLIGAGETSIFAVVRTMEKLLANPEKLAEAVAYAEAGDDEALAHYVWEALRFYPINPWVERYATEDYKIYAIPEAADSITDMRTIVDANRKLNDKVSPGRDPAFAKYPDYTIQKDARVMVAMQSAFMDSEKFPNPKVFDTKRPLEDYFHVSIDYHRCLGDDVVDAMIPEIFKQLLVNLKGLKAVDKDGKPTRALSRLPEFPNFKDGPFPESWSLRFDSKSPQVSTPSSQMAAAKQMLAEKVPSAAKVDTQAMVKYINDQTDQSRVMDSTKRFNLATFKEIRSQMGKAHVAIVRSPTMNTAEYCVNNPEMAVENLRPDALAGFCKLPMRFRSCFFLERTAGLKSTQHAFNFCAHQWKFLEDVASFKAQFSGLDAFAFLEYQK